jgi:hypothetical protein
VSDRLEEFRRQRNLLREQLLRLDREIAGLEGNAPQAPFAEPTALPPADQVGAPPADSEAEAILAEFRQPAVSIQKRARAGCLLYFAAALAIMVLFVAVLYVLVKRAHGH